MNDPRVDPNACDRWGLSKALKDGHLEAAKLVLYDYRMDPELGKKYLAVLERN